MAEQTHRVNDQIRITPVRVVGADGEMLGVIPTSDALRMALDSGMDLVEVAPTVRPPVCRIMDFGKFKYEQQKKKKGNVGKQPEIKEIRLRPKTGDHDIDFKIKQARGFLEHRHKVKLNVMFRGRENAHHEKGREVIEEVIKLLDDVAKVEATPRMDGGRSMSAVLAPREIKAADAKPGDAKPGDGKSGDGKPGDAKPTSETKSAETRPLEAKPVETKPALASATPKPAEGRPATGAVAPKPAAPKPAR